MTRLPSTAPAPYARSQLGERTLAWCRDRWPGFDANAVKRIDRSQQDILRRIKEITV